MVLIELLTGSRMRRTGEVCRIQRDQFNQAISQDLEAICLKATEPNSDQRYGSAADFAEDLRRYLEGRVVSARPCGIIGSLHRWGRRSPALAALAVLLISVTMLGLAAVLVQWDRAESNLQSRKHREQQISLSLERTRLTLSEMIEHSGLSSLTQGIVTEPHQEDLLRIVIKCYEDFVCQFDGDRDMRAELEKMYHKLAQLHIALNQDEARGLLDKSVAIQEEPIRDRPLDVELHQRMGNIWRSYGFYWKHHRELAEAARAFERAIESWRRALPESTSGDNRHTRLVYYHAEIGYLWRNAGFPEESLQAWQEVIRVCESVPDEALADTYVRGHHAIAHYQVGVTQRHIGRLGASWSAHIQAAELLGGLCEEDPGSERWKRYLKANDKQLRDLGSNMADLKWAPVLGSPAD